MNDEGSDIIFSVGKTKLVMGVLDGNDIYYWKFPPSSAVSPLVYVLNSSDKISYDGKWAPIQIPIKAFVNGVEGNPKIPQIKTAVQARNGNDAMQILETINKKSIESYLEPSLISDIRNISEYTATFSLEALHAFPA